MLNRKMPDLRAKIVAEMERQHLRPIDLVRALKGKRKGGDNVPQATIYEFVRGDTAINSDDLGLICDVLGLDLLGRRK